MIVDMRQEVTMLDKVLELFGFLETGHTTKLVDDDIYIEPTEVKSW